MNYVIPKPVHRTAKEWLAEKDDLSRLCELGYTVTECAQHYGVAVATMAAVFNALGLRTDHVKLRDELIELAAKQREVQ